MKLIHYTNKEFELENRKYDQSELSWQAKPNGLWISVEGEEEFGWKEWCEEEKFNLENLFVSYEIILKKDANILFLRTQDDVFNFGKEYPWLREQWNDPIGRDLCRTYELDWNRVKQKYQGIIISPYQWECPISPKSCWYYGWDCASGCIWDLECIEEFKLRENE